MYESFYQLTTNPFRLAPDPNFCFTHSGYKRAREYLEYVLDQGEGFVMVTGRPGTGKTLLLETFLKEVDSSRVAARRIAVSNYSGEDLLRAVAYAYDIDAAELDKATLRHRIHQYFIQQEQAGRQVLLIIDEAQALQHTALEELRILADLQTQSRLMLQLFLVGQESLQDLMHSPDMEQFQQRVIANYQLVPLNLGEARAYIEYRLLHAGWNGDPEFTSTAMLAIYQLSNGVPRHINKICNRLMLLGFGKGSHRIEIEDVQAISVEMREEQLTPMETGQDLFTGSDSVASTPEIRDGLLSLSDLAIRADKIDANALAVSEVTRPAAQNKAAYNSRHDQDPATWCQEQAAPVSSQEEPAAVLTAQLNASHAPDTDIVDHGDTAAEQTHKRFKWRQSLVATAAVLAITTISIAALPSLLGVATEKDTFSHMDHQILESQDTSANGLSEDEFIADETAVAVTADLVEFRTPSTDGDEAVVTSEMQEDKALVATSDVLDTIVTENTIPVPPVTARISWDDTTGRTQPLESEQQVAVAESFEHTGIVKVSYQSSVGTIDRQASSLGESQSAAAESDRMASVTETVEPTDSIQDETIKSLLAQGRQSLDDFRLMTPDEDNAYGHFHAVLQLDPANVDAQAGIEEIVDVYITLIRKEIDQHENDRANRYLERGLSIQPANRELLALKDSIAPSIGRATADRVPAAHTGPVSQGTASAKERATQDSMMLGIKTFYKRRQAEGRRGEVSTPSGWDG